MVVWLGRGAITGVAAVDSGRIDADHMADMLENMRAQLEDIVASTDLPPAGGMGGRGMGGGAGMFGNAPVSDTTGAGSLSL